MEGTHAFPKMVEIDLIISLEKISSRFTNRILILEGYILKKNKKEPLEIIIFKGFSSSTTHPIEVDLERRVIEFDYTLTNFRLHKSPLRKAQNSLIRENQNSSFFLKEKNWI